MRVAFAASGRRRDTEQVRFHHRVTPRKQFHADSGAGFEDLALLRTDAAGIRLRRIEEREDVLFVEAGEAAERGNGGAHVAALEGAEEADGDTSGFCHASERVAAGEAQAPQAGANWAGLGLTDSRAENALRFEQMDNGGSVHAARGAEELGALEEAEVGVRVKAVMAARTDGRDEAQIFPRAEHRRGYANHVRNVADAQIAVRRSGLRSAILNRANHENVLDNLRVIF